MSKPTPRPLLIVTIGLFLFSCGSLADRARAYNLGTPECGGEYGGLNLKFSKRFKTFAEVHNLLSSLKWANASFRSIDYPYKPTTIQKEIKRIWAPGRGGETEDTDIEVPISSEEYVATELTKMGVISKASYSKGACGGAEVIYFRIAKDKVGDLSEGPRFEAFVREEVAAYTAQANGQATVDEGPLAVDPIEPNYGVKRFTVALPSTVSRGPQAEGTWDKFDLIVSLHRELKSDYAIVVHTENFRVAPKTAARLIPPTNEHFRSTTSGNSLADYQAEYIAATSFALFAAKSSSKCVAEAEGFSSVDEGPFHCTMKGR